MSYFVAERLDWGPKREKATVLSYRSHNILIQRQVGDGEPFIAVKGVLDRPEHVGDLVSKMLQDGAWDPHVDEYDHFIGTSMHKYRGPDSLEEISPFYSLDLSEYEIHDAIPYNTDRTEVVIDV